MIDLAKPSTQPGHPSVGGLMGTSISWESNHSRSGVTLAMRHRHSSTSIYGLNGLSKEIHLWSSDGTAHFTLNLPNTTNNTPGLYPSVWPHLFRGAGHEKRSREQSKWSLAFRLYIGSFPCAQLPGPVHTARLGRVCFFIY